MQNTIKIQSAFISVYNKDGLEPIIEKLNALGVKIYASGGSAEFIRSMEIMVEEISNVTGYPSILGGRVKTLHPKVFGGILANRDLEDHQKDLKEYDLPTFDVVIVDLYPFAKSLEAGAEEAKLIELIDIGGVSLIRAAAKNFKHVVCVPAQKYYANFLSILNLQDGNFTYEERRYFSKEGFNVSAHYDMMIYKYFAGEPETTVLRYGENPHQEAHFRGDLDEVFDKLNGKELSYNNLLDVESAFRLIADFSEPTFAIIEHTNPCGIASRNTVLDCWNAALECDPLSAFGGVLITNQTIDLATAKAINSIFFEVLIAKGFDSDALELLKSNKNRILLQYKTLFLPQMTSRSILNGTLTQSVDMALMSDETFRVVTNAYPDVKLKDDLIFAEKAMKHLKSNAIAIVKNKQMIGSGLGQTSRVDALKQALAKTKEKGFSLENSILASDGFFPFADSVQLANENGIKTILQPGGSVKDQDSIKYCDENNMVMIFTSLRHFKH